MRYVGQLEPPNFKPDFTRSGEDNMENVLAAVIVSSKSLGRTDGRTNAKLTACPANHSKKTY